MGTAVTISPVGFILDSENETQVGNGQAGEISMSLRQELIDIQFGNVSDKYGWTEKI